MVAILSVLYTLVHAGPLLFIYIGTPLIPSPKGQKKKGRINEGFFYKKMSGGFCQTAKK